MPKTIVITGASSGIGAAAATALATRGDRVVLAARRKGELEKLAQQLGPNAFAVVTDVTVRAEVERLRDRCRDLGPGRGGRLSASVEAEWLRH
jgi:NADP-dependent 3-hydroxy acid dehydrogenase YdfG